MRGLSEKLKALTPEQLRERDNLLSLRAGLQNPNRQKVQRNAWRKKWKKEFPTKSDRKALYQKRKATLGYAQRRRDDRARRYAMEKDAYAHALEAHFASGDTEQFPLFCVWRKNHRRAIRLFAAKRREESRFARLVEVERELLQKYGDTVEVKKIVLSDEERRKRNRENWLRWFNKDPEKNKAKILATRKRQYEKDPEGFMEKQRAASRKSLRKARARAKNAKRQRELLC